MSSNNFNLGDGRIFVLWTICISLIVLVVLILIPVLNKSRNYHITIIDSNGVASTYVTDKYKINQSGCVEIKFPNQKVLVKCGQINIE